jgi:hypothetical protein
MARFLYGRRLPAQKLLLGSVVYEQAAPPFTGEAPNPAFQSEVLGKHDGAGGAMWFASLNADGMVTPNP